MESTAPRSSAPLPVDEMNSIIVRNIAPTTEPPTHKVIADFFSFCGNITALSVAPDDRATNNNSAMAVVTFQTKAAARTAVLLNNALINERAIQVELAPSGFSVSTDAPTPKSAVLSVPMSELPPHSASGEEQSQTSVIVSMLAKGYTLQKDTLSSAKKFDEDYAVSKKASDLADQAAQGVRNLDAQLGVSAALKSWGDSLQSKAVEFSETYQLNEKTQAASQVLGDFGRTVGNGLQGAAVTTGGYMQQSPSVQNAQQTVSGWAASVSNVFREAKSLSDVERPEPLMAAPMPPQQ